VPEVKKGTATSNILIKRYLQANPWVRNPHASEDRARFETAVAFFRRYGERYGFDWLMLAAPGYQESPIDQSVRSRAGAVGIMQVLPSTAADPNAGTPDISEPEHNILSR
jgi:membrane-bound lytic murein transglycosylase MltF